MKQDDPSVDAAGARLDPGIDGVKLRMLGPLHADHRGSLLEVIDAVRPNAVGKLDSFWAEPIVYAYRFIVRPGRIKGWGMHMLQTDRYLCLSGRLRVVLYQSAIDPEELAGQRDADARLAEFYFTDETPGLLAIPPGVWHADQNVGDTDAVVINFPTRAYDPASPDKYRIDPHSGEIPFDWALRDY